MPGKLTHTGLLRGSHTRVGARLSVGRKAGRNEPALAPTFPMPGATLDLDFTTNRGYVKGAGIGTAMERLLFQRASTGTYMRADGTLQTAGLSEPRFDCDVPTTRTNAQVWSETGDGWQAGGTTPPTVAVDAQRGVACARVDFDATMTTGYAGSRATRTAAGYSFPMQFGNALAWSADVMLSRPLTGTEALAVYITGGTGVGQFLLNAANSAAYVGAFVRIAVGNVGITQDGSDYFTVFNNGGVTSPVSLWITRLHAEFNGPGFPAYIPTLGAAVTVASTTPRGLLLEEVRTNYCYNTANYAAWSTYVTGTATVARSIVTDPVMGQVLRLTKTAGANADRAGVSTTVVGLTTQYAVSGMFKVNTPNLLPDGTSSYPVYVDAQTGGTPSLNTVAPLLNGFPYTPGQWTKAAAYSSGVLAPSGTASSAYHFFTGPVGVSMDFACMQVENGGGAGGIGDQYETSWIPTPGAAAVQRQQDICALLGPDFDATFSRGQGTLLIECDYIGGAGRRSSNRVAAAIEQIGGNGYIGIVYNGNGFCNSIYVMDTNSVVVFFEAGKVAVSAAVRQALSWLHGSLSAQQGIAGAAYRNTPGLPEQFQPANRLGLGGTRGGTTLGGRIKRLTLLPDAMPQSQMRALFGI